MNEKMESTSPEPSSASEKTCRKRKHSQSSQQNTSNSNFATPVSEVTVKRENYVMPQTPITFPPLVQPTFTNFYNNHFSDVNQYGMIPQYQWSLPHTQPMMCHSLPKADTLPFEQKSNDQVSNGQQVLLPENNYPYGMTSGFEPYKSFSYVRQPITLSSCVLYPPSPNTKITRKEKPPGCRTVFIGGLPTLISEDIIREAFGFCGTIVTVRMNTKKFCHVRFSKQEEVENAFILSGYRIKIENKDEGPYSGRLHVDYAVAKDDQRDAECAEREANRKARHQILKEQEALEMSKPRVNSFSDTEFNNLIAQFKNGKIKDGIVTLNTWLRRGEVGKRNAVSFFSAIQTLYHNIRRLLSEKKNLEEGNKKAKLLHRQKLQDISSQLDDFKKLFKEAESQKNWDHFNKVHRKYIGMWKKQTSEIKKANFEKLIDERIEAEMEVSDDESSQSEDTPQLEETKLLQKQIDEVESSIASLEKKISSIRVEKEDALKSLSHTLNTHENNRKILQEEYEKHLSLQVINNTNKDNSVIKSVPSSGVTNFQKDACLLSLICQFLFVHPYSVSTQYLICYLKKIISSVSHKQITDLMGRYPAVFNKETSGIGPSLQTKWSLKRLQSNLE